MTFRMSAVLAFVSVISIPACKQRGESQLLDADFTYNQNQSPDDTKSIRTGRASGTKRLTDKPTIIQLTDAPGGMVKITLRVNPVAGAAAVANPNVRAFLFTASDLNQSIVSGPLLAGAGNRFTGKIINIVKPEDLFLILDHDGALNNTADLRYAVSFSKEETEEDEDGILINKIVTSEPIEFSMKSKKGLFKLDLGYTVASASSKVIIDGASTPCPDQMQIVFDENEGAAPDPLDISPLMDASIYQGECQVALYGAYLEVNENTHGYKVVVPTTSAGSFINLDAYQYRQNVSTDAGNWGVVPIKVDDYKSISGKFKRNVPVGFEFKAKKDQVIIHSDVSIRRVINKGTGPIKQLAPGKMEVIDASGRVIASMGISTGFGGDDDDDSGTELPVVFGTGTYRILYTLPDELTANDYVKITAELYPTLLEIEDPVPPVSSYTDPVAVTLPPPKNYMADLGGTDQPGSYTPETPSQELPMKSTLMAMEEIRNTFHKATAAGITKTKGNYVTIDTVGACLGNVAEHWSDIILHYYCQFGSARSCYTNTIRSKAQALGADTSLSPAQKAAAAGLLRSEAYATCAATAGTDLEWNWITTNQAEMFQFIMESQTFAFDFAQQQKVINAYYRVKNPNSKSECNKKRPRRAIDPDDGTHCRIDKKLPSTVMKALGR